MEKIKKKTPYKNIVIICLLVIILLLVWLVAMLMEKNNSQPSAVDPIQIIEETEGNEERISSTIQFSHESGFYDENISLELSSTLENAEIYYTLDGSIPTIESERYEQPIEIASRLGHFNKIANIRTSYLESWQEPGEVRKGTVIRAAVFVDGERIDEVSTHSYFIGALRDIYTLPVISLVVHPDYFFDDEIGIYVPGNLYQNSRPHEPWFNPGNYSERGREWERPAHMEYFETDKSLAFAQQVGVRIHGGASRTTPQKSLRIYARNSYGEKYIEHPIFPNQSLDQYKRLLLRQSGNDWPSTMFRDALMQGLIEHLDVDTQAYQPAILFINGEYWGIHNIRERHDKHYLATNYGVPDDNIDLLKENRNVQEGDSEQYDHLISYVESNDMSEQHHYEYVQTLMDVDNYIHYQVAEIYFQNTDWPGNNIRYWRLRTEYNPDAEIPEHDGRFRWMHYDTDFGFSLYEGSEGYKHNTLQFATMANGPDWPNPDWSTLLLRTLLENQDFQHNFINTFADHLNMWFHPDRVLDMIDQFKERLEPEMAEHINRWGHPYSINHWDENVEVLRIFARNRPDYVRNHIIEQFDLYGMYQLQLSPFSSEEGNVSLNTLSFDGLSANWYGTYFTNVPITLEAEAKPGYRFTGWGGDINETAERITINLLRDTRIEAQFVKE